MYRKVWSVINNENGTIIYNYLFVKDKNIYYASSLNYTSNNPNGTIIKSYTYIPKELFMVRFKYLDFINELHVENIGSIVYIKHRNDTSFVFY